MTKRKLQQCIDQVLGQVVELVKPTRVILFGSAATGAVTPDSDLDFLVVVPGKRDCEEAVDRLNREVRHKPMPCDFLVVTAGTLRQTKDRSGLIYGEILKHGREVYAA